LALPKYDAYALRCKLSGLDVPEGLPLSTFVQAIVDNPNFNMEMGMQLMSVLGDGITSQIMKIDPTQKPDGDGMPVLIHASQLKNLPPIEWLQKPILPKQGLTTLYGGSGDGKSFYAIHTALTIAQSHSVVYMVGEGQHGYPSRVGAWCKHHHKTEGKLYMHMESVSLSDPAALEMFIETITPTNPDLVVVDTVARAMTGFDENSTRDMGVFIQACNKLMKRLDCAVLLVHHTNKGGIVERGSGALRGASDAMIRLHKEDDTILLECAKTKDAEPFETKAYKLVSVKYDTEFGEMASAVLVPSERVAITDMTPLSHIQKKILEVLAMVVNDGGLDRAEIRNETNIPNGTLGRALNTLLAREFVEQDGYGKPYTITSKGLEKIGKGKPK